MVADAPQRLRKQVDTVLSLQDEVAAVQIKIDEARHTLAEAGASRGTKASLKTLGSQQEQLLAGVDALYTSLNIQEEFPELKGVDIEFVRTLLLARDLKINIRKRAIGSFLEWDKLDQAVGGKNQALGKYFRYLNDDDVIYLTQERRCTNVRAQQSQNGPQLLCDLYVPLTNIALSYLTSITPLGQFRYRPHFQPILRTFETDQICLKMSGFLGERCRHHDGYQTSVCVMVSALCTRKITVQKSVVA